MKKVGVAILGLGDVGSGVYQILTEHSGFYRSAQNVDLSVVSIFEGDAARAEQLGVPSQLLVRNVAEIATDPEVGIVVECLSDAEEAKELALACLYAGKTVVVSNSEAFAKYSGELGRTARRHNAGLLFESCVSGLPVLRTLLDGLQSNVVSRVICTVSPSMSSPEAAYRLSVLASVAFHAEIPFGKIACEETEVSAEDVSEAAVLGYAPRRLAIAKTTDGGVEVRVHPALVRCGSPLCADSSYSAVLVTGDSIGDVVLSGIGSGALPAGSIAVSDVLYAAAHDEPQYTASRGGSESAPPKLITDYRSAYFFRMTTPDDPATLSKLTSILTKSGVAVKAFVRHTPEGGKAAVALVTQEMRESTVESVVTKLNASGFVQVESVLRVVL